MDFLTVALRMCDPRSYFPVVFTGEGWTEQEQKAVLAMFAPHCPERVSATWNNWVVSKLSATSAWYHIRRAT